MKKFALLLLAVVLWCGPIAATKTKHNNPICKTQGVHWKPKKGDPDFNKAPFIWVEYCGDISWKDADAWCKKKFNTHLASIHCNTSQSWAIKLCHHEESEEKDHNNHCWIGMHDQGGGKWGWADGSKVDYHAWVGGKLKPNDPKHIKDCGSMSSDAAHKHNFKSWDSHSCSYGITTFLCKNPNAPDPCSTKRPTRAKTPRPTTSTTTTTTTTTTTPRPTPPKRLPSTTTTTTSTTTTTTTTKKPTGTPTTTTTTTTKQPTGNPTTTTTTTTTKQPTGNPTTTTTTKMPTGNPTTTTTKQPTGNPTTTTTTTKQPTGNPSTTTTTTTKQPTGNPTTTTTTTTKQPTGNPTTTKQPTGNPTTTKQPTGTPTTTLQPTSAPTACRDNTTWLDSEGRSCRVLYAQGVCNNVTRVQGPNAFPSADGVRPEVACCGCQIKTTTSTQAAGSATAPCGPNWKDWTPPLGTVANNKTCGDYVSLGFCVNGNILDFYVALARGWADGQRRTCLTCCPQRCALSAGAAATSTTKAGAAAAAAAGSGQQQQQSATTAKTVSALTLEFSGANLNVDQATGICTAAVAGVLNVPNAAVIPVKVIDNTPPADKDGDRDFLCTATVDTHVYPNQVDQDRFASTFNDPTTKAKVQQHATTAAATTGHTVVVRSTSASASVDAKTMTAHQAENGSGAKTMGLTTVLILIGVALVVVLVIGFWVWYGVRKCAEKRSAQAANDMSYNKDMNTPLINSGGVNDDQL